jgi:hypothetical protein
MSTSGTSGFSGTSGLSGHSGKPKASIPIFVQPDDTVTVKFVIALRKDDPKTVYADVSEEMLRETYDDADLTTLQYHEAVFRMPSYEDQSQIYADSVVYGEKGIAASPAMMQFSKLARLLKSWTLPKPATVESVRTLNRIIALVISSELERLT